VSRRGSNGSASTWSRAPSRRSSCEVVHPKNVVAGKVGAGRRNWKASWHGLEHAPERAGRAEHHGLDAYAARSDGASHRPVVARSRFRALASRRVSGPANPCRATNAGGAPQVAGRHAPDEAADHRDRWRNGHPWVRLRQAQYRRNPARCHWMTVAGLTMIRTSLQRHHRRDSNTRKPRSTLVSRGRLAEREGLDGRLAQRSEQCECRDEQGADDIQHGSAAWSGSAQISTISRSRGPRSQGVRKVLRRSRGSPSRWLRCHLWEGEAVLRCGCEGA
jgi:hypothetical protein